MMDPSQQLHGPSQQIPRTTGQGQALRINVTCGTQPAIPPDGHAYCNACTVFQPLSRGATVLEPITPPAQTSSPWHGI